MTSEEFRTNPLLLRNQFERTGTFEIPLIHKDEVSLENLSLIGYDKVSSGKNDQVVHFFLDDYKFESRWNNPEPRIEKLSTFRAVLSPQFSIYSEMPIAVQIHNTFRSRWCGANLQSKGIKVVPSVVWGEADTFWFCFDGIEKGSIVAVSTVGVRNEKDLFMAGYRELMKRIEPSAIICYGKPFEEMSGNVIYVSYEETNNYHPKAGECKHLSSLCLCVTCGYHRSAVFLALYNNGGGTKSAYQSVSSREIEFLRLGTRSVFGKNTTVLDYRTCKSKMH